MTESLPFRLPVALAALATSAFGGYALIGGAPGIGFPLTAVAIALTVAFATGRSAWTRDRSILAALASALIAMAAVRDAPWVIAVDVTVGLCFAALAMTGVSTWRSILAAPANAVVDAFWAPISVTAALVRSVGPQQHRRLAPAVRGSVVGVFLVVIFGTLFVSADSAFAQIAEDLFAPSWDTDLLPARIVVAVVIVCIIGALLSLRARGDEGADEAGDPFGPPAGFLRGKIRARAEWVVPLALLDVLFVAFVAVQIAVLFGGREHVLSTAGVTFAEYARSGFFQLLVVAFLTLAVIALAVNATRRDDPKDRSLLNGLLAVLCVCTLVILASAFDRLTLYEETYGFTRLRVAVHATILWLAGVFICVMAAGIRRHAAWLPRALVLLTGGGLLTLTLMNPDALIARRNVERLKATGKLDPHYLSTLSADAVPALQDLDSPQKPCILEDIEARIDDEPRLMSWNYSRAHASDLLDRTSDEECPAG